MSGRASLVALVAVAALVLVSLFTQIEVLNATTAIADVAVADAVVAVRADVPDLPNAFAKKTGATGVIPRTITVNGKELSVDPLLTDHHQHNSWLIKSDDERQDIIDWIRRRFDVDEQQLAPFSRDELRRLNNGLSATLRLDFRSGKVTSTIDEERPLVECYWRGSRCRPCQQADAKLASLKPPFDVRTIVVGPNHPLPAGAFGPCYTIPVKEGGRIWVYRYANEQEDIVDKLMRIYRQRN